jgi:phenylacetate-CoA ligase
MILNWRKPLILSGLAISGSSIPSYIREIERVSRLSNDEINKYQQVKLECLLMHAYQNVPHYRRVLSEANVISRGKVHLENFYDIPILTKPDIRKHFQDLQSNNKNLRKCFLNRTGGSTGQPLTFIQDKEYEEQNYANKIYYCKVAGKDIGETEMKIWGSERDIIQSSNDFQKRLKMLLYGRIFENSFVMDKTRIKAILGSIKKYKPIIIWGYVTSLYILSKYIVDENICVHKPKAVLTTSGTLIEDIRKAIKCAFDCPVLNVYGCREVGDIAFESIEKGGLNIFQNSHYVELKDIKSQPYKEVIITSLNNYSMPFIRYSIGDISSGFCPKPEYSFSKLKNVIGRETAIFKTKVGSYIPPEFFIHIIGVVFNTGFIDHFQVIQNDYEKVTIKLVLKHDKDEVALKRIKAAIRSVMGSDCRVDFEIVDSIKPNKSGKFQYTICELRNENE